MPQKRKRCYVNNCIHSDPNNSQCEVKSFHFPCNVERQKKWIEFCCNPLLKEVSQRNLLRNFFICHTHFNREDFTSDLKEKLVQHRDVVPSQHPPSQFASHEETHHVQKIQVSYSQTNDDERFSNDELHQSFHTPPSTNSNNQQSLDLHSKHVEFEYVPNPFMKETVSPTQSFTLSRNKHYQPVENSKVPVVFTKKQMTSPRKLQMYTLLKSKEKALKRLKRSNYQKRKQTLSIIQDISKLDFTQFSKKVELINNMTKISKTFLISQARNTSKPAKGRRWSLEEKLMALAFYKKSPRMYQYMKCIFSLPCKRTLNALLKGVPFETGINRNIFDTLAARAEKMEDCDKACVLLFDEMSIQEHLSYDPSTDRIMGVEDCGESGRTANTANQAMVFMVCGIFRKWKQPIAFYFTKDGVSANVLVDIMVEVLSACFEAGLNVLATVCDLGTKQRKALKILGSSTENPCFQFEGKTIVTILDPPHLIKCTRNQLQLHDVHCTWKVDDFENRGIASWKHIKETYERDLQSEPFRLLYKVTERHITPTGRLKLKVKLATQVLSHSVAASIYRDVSQGLMTPTAIATAHFVEFFDKLFDSLNGSKRYETKELRRVITRDSPHIKFWEESIKMVDSLQFESSKENEAYQRPPSQDGWILTLRGMRMLWEEVKKMEKGGQKIQFFVPRNVNQDPLENTFGAIRSHCGSNSTPNVVQFIGALKTCIINGLAYQEAKEGMNCEEDGGTVLTNLQTLLTCGEEPVEKPFSCTSSQTNLESSVSDLHLVAAPTDLSAVAYVSGYIAKRILTNLKCHACRRGLVNPNPHECCNVAFLFKEFDNQPRLTYPSEDLVRAVDSCSKLLETCLNDNFYKDNIFAFVSVCMNEHISFEWLAQHCVEHKVCVKDQIIKSVVMIGVPWWCKRTNRTNSESRRRRKK